MLSRTLDLSLSGKIKNCRILALFVPHSISLYSVWCLFNSIVPVENNLSMLPFQSDGYDISAVRKIKFNDTFTGFIYFSRKTSTFSVHLQTYRVHSCRTRNIIKDIWKIFSVILVNAACSFLRCTVPSPNMLTERHLLSHRVVVIYWVIYLSSPGKTRATHPESVELEAQLSR